MFERFGRLFEVMQNKFEEIQKRFEKVENQFLSLEDSRYRDRHRERLKSAQNHSQGAATDFLNDTEVPGYQSKCSYIVAGGYGTGKKLLNSAEAFDRTCDSWTPLQPMGTCRAEASSVVYNGQVLVAGGLSDGNRIVSSLEQFSRFWSKCSVNLPRALMGHRSLLSDDKMFIFGGFDAEKKDYSDLIYEVELHFPFTTRVLAKLPPSTPIRGCGFVLTNNTILMFGGLARDSSNLPTACVTMFDITKKEFKELAPLPYDVWNMATVRYRENVYLAGGSDQYLFVGIKDTVIRYNIETQDSVILPAMEAKRSECCAIVDGHSLVVMGGNGKNGTLKSVEKFDLQTWTWKKLPPMNEARKAFIAEIY